MKLLLATACDRVIQDPESGHSLISVFHEIKIAVPLDAEFPSNAVVPKEWAVFSKWGLEPKEEGKEYKCSVDIFWPDGSLFVRQELVIPSSTTKSAISFVVRLGGFPIGQNGKLKITHTILSEGTVVSGPTELTVLVTVNKTAEMSAVTVNHPR